MIDKTKLEHDLATSERTGGLSLRGMLKVILIVVLGAAVFFLLNLISDISEQNKKITELESRVNELQTAIKGLTADDGDNK